MGNASLIGIEIHGLSPVGTDFRGPGDAVWQRVLYLMAPVYNGNPLGQEVVYKLASFLNNLKIDFLSKAAISHEVHLSEQNCLQFK